MIVKSLREIVNNEKSNPEIYIKNIAFLKKYLGGAVKC